jgi:serine/threonine protein kinase
MRQGRFGTASPSPWLEETQTPLAAADTTVEVRGDKRPRAPDLAPTPRSLGILEMLKKLSHVDAVLWMISRLAEGLAHAHERGILHLDLKPANVLLTDEGQPMLLDFNLARDTKCPLDRTGPLIGGTLSYMSPEHLRAFRREDVTVDARSDIYSLGMLFYEMLTGRPTFPSHDGPVKEVLSRMLDDRNGPPPSVRRWNKAVSRGVESILHHCLDPLPSRRYQSASELFTDIQRQLHHQPLEHAPEPFPYERARKWFRRHPRLVSSSSAIIALETAVIIALLCFSASRRGDVPSPGTASAAAPLSAQNGASTSWSGATPEVNARAAESR